MADAVHHPPHYTSHPSGIECIEVVRHMNFNRGNAFKYIWRAGEKGNILKEIEDIEKAVWYLNDEVKRLREMLMKGQSDQIEIVQMKENTDNVMITPKGGAPLSVSALKRWLSKYGVMPKR